VSEHSPEAETAANKIDPGLTNVLFDVWLVSRAVHALIDDAIGPSGLDADEFAIYSVLASDTAMTPSELADWMAAPPTTVSSYVKRFERRGHVRRVPNPEDRRSYRLELTATGRQAHHAAGALFRPALDHVNEALEDSAGDTRRRLLELRRVVDTLPAAARDPQT
jgi:DNA-binding MarR family transcriptional regulator